MNTIESGTRVQPAHKIILGTGLELSQADNGDTIISVAAGISSIGIQDGDAGDGVKAATRLVFQGTGVVSVDDATGIATFTLDSRYQLAPPAGYSWTVTGGVVMNQFNTPYGYIQLGPANLSAAHIYSDRPIFYFNKEIQVNGSTVWHSGNDGPGSGLNADTLDSQQGSYYLDWNNTTNKPVYATRWPTTTEVGLSRFVNAPVQGNSGPFGAVRITGSEGSYSGIQFADAAVTLMVYNVSGVLRQGFYRYTSAPTVGWEWYFENGVLTVGTVPWGRLTGMSSVSPTFVSVFATDWFRNTVNATGLFNEANNYYWYSDSTVGRWISRSLSGIELRDPSAVTKGTLLFTAIGFGLSNSTGTWSVRCFPGQNGGQLHGTWWIDDPDVLNFGATTRQMIDLYNSANGHQYGIGVQSATVYFRTDGGFAFFNGGSHVSSPANSPGTGGTLLARLDSGGYFYAARFSDKNNPAYYISAAGTSILNNLQINTKLNTIGSVPISLDIAAGANHYPYIEWKYGGVRGAYMGWGTPGTQIDLTLENNNKFVVNGIMDVVGILRNNGNPITPTVVSTTAPGDVSVYPVGTRFIVHA